MKLTILTLFVLLLGTSFCFAEQATFAAPAAETKTPEIKTLIGKVDSVTMGDPAKSRKSEIVVVDDKDKKTTFLVKSNTNISNVDGKPLTLDKIKKADKVKVSYIMTKEGVDEAKSIILIKQ